MMMCLLHVCEIANGQLRTVEVADNAGEVKRAYGHSSPGESSCASGEMVDRAGSVCNAFCAAIGGAARDVCTLNSHQCAFPSVAVG